MNEAMQKKAVKSQRLRKRGNSSNPFGTLLIDKFLRNAALTSSTLGCLDLAFFTSSKSENNLVRKSKDTDKN